MIDRLAVQNRPRAARVVGDHAADGGAAGGGDVGREPQPVRPQLRVQVVEHDARLDPGACVPTTLTSSTLLKYFEVSSCSPAPIAWPACDVPPPRAVIDTPWRAAIWTVRIDVLARARDDHAERFDLVDAGVGGVERPRDAIESHLAVEMAVRDRAGEPRSPWAQDDVGRQADGVEPLHHALGRLRVGIFRLELDLHVAGERRLHRRRSSASSCPSSGSSCTTSPTCR